MMWSFSYLFIPKAVHAAVVCCSSLSQDKVEKRICGRCAPFTPVLLCRYFQRTSERLVKFSGLMLIVFVILPLWCQVSYWLAAAGTKVWDGPSRVQSAHCAVPHQPRAQQCTRALLQATSVAWAQMEVNQWWARGFSACALQFFVFFCQSCSERVLSHSEPVQSQQSLLAW